MGCEHNVRQMLGHLQALIFDHDGTLVDSEPLHAKAWSAVLQQYGVTHVFADHIQAIGRSALERAEGLVNEHSLSVTPTELLAKKHEAMDYFIDIEGIPLVSGVKRVIDWATAEGIKLGVSSGSSRHEVARSLQIHRLEDVFSAVSTSTDVQQTKPAPDVYLRTLDLMGVSVKNVVAIEDSAVGIESATGADLTTVAIWHDYVPEAWVQKAQKRFRKFSEIHTWLQQIYTTSTPC